jgi:hypothetical protein
MSLHDIEQLWSQITLTPLRAIAFLAATALIGAIGIWAKAYFSEVGKRQAESRHASPKAAALEIVALTVKKPNSLHPVIDIKLLNKGEGTAFLTEIVAEVLERHPTAGMVEPSGRYDLLIDSNVNVLAVSHSIKPNDVDRLHLRLGAARQNLACAFKLQLKLIYNKSQEVQSAPFNVFFVRRLF